jgi:squalene cyclase
MKKLKLTDVYCVFFELVELAQCGEMSVQKLCSQLQQKTNNAGGDSNSCFAPTEMDSPFFFREAFGPGLIL